MILRYANNYDTPAIKELWKSEFESWEPYFSWYFTRVYRPELTLVCCDGSEIVAVTQIAPYLLNLRSTKVTAAYLVGVVSSPARRGEGFGRAIIKYTIAELKQKNISTALLYSDIPDFYLPLGFRHCYWQQYLSWPAKSGETTLWRKGAICADDIYAIDKIYRQMHIGCHGQLLRNLSNWQKLLEEAECDQATIEIASNSYLISYTEGSSLRLREMGYTDQDAFTSAKTKATSIAASKGLSNVDWNAPIDLPSDPTVKTHPFVMARLVDYQNLLPILPYPTDTAASFQFTIDQDPPFCLNIGNGGMIMPVATDIGSLTQLVFGAKAADTSHFEATSQTLTLLNKCFPPMRCRINEYT